MGGGMNLQKHGVVKYLLLLYKQDVFMLFGLYFYIYTVVVLLSSYKPLSQEVTSSSKANMYIYVSWASYIIMLMTAEPMSTHQCG